MDFASLMKSAIGKTAAPARPDKYVRRAELEAEREEAYRSEQAKVAQAKAEKAAAKRKFEEEEAEQESLQKEKRQRLVEESRIWREQEKKAEEDARRKRLGLPPLAEKKAIEEAPAPEDDIEDDELRTLLRGLDQPMALFAESHTARLKRYKVLTTKETLTTGPIPTTLELLPEVEMAITTVKAPKAGQERNYIYRQLASYFTMILEEWIKALDRRDPTVKASREGQNAYAAMDQSRANLEPLFRKFEKGNLEDSVLEPIMEIVAFAQKRRYVDANDAYLQLSIGKAAWPIGVTMVGIHERSAREKLNEHGRETAHILSDESTRKYLQAVKRCLSFAQTRWPPDDHMQLMG